MVFAEDIVEEDTIEYFELWETNQSIFEIYKTVRNYTSKDYELNGCDKVITTLAKSLKIKPAKALTLIPFIHSGFVSMMIANRDLDDGQNS